MNTHVQKTIQDNWPQMEFRGRPFILNGKKYIRARYKSPEVRSLLKETQYYDFAGDCFWFASDFMVDKK